jgi:hypothetical protein
MTSRQVLDVLRPADMASSWMCSSTGSGHILTSSGRIATGLERSREDAPTDLQEPIV